jgi:AraC-like DNA-binding protein
MDSELSEALRSSCFFRNFIDFFSSCNCENFSGTIRSDLHWEREILMVIRGKTEFSYHDRKIIMDKGDVLFIDSWEPHQYGYGSVCEKCLHLWLHLHTEHLFANIIEISNGVQHNHPLMELPDDLLSAINRRWDAAKNSQGRKKHVTEYYQSIVRLLQEELLWNALTPCSSSDRESLENQLKNFLSVNYGHRVTLEELEKLFKRDRSYLSRLFKKAYGCTIGEFIDQNRERYAATASERGMTQKEIAAQLGFSSASAFWLWRKRRSIRRNG